MHGRKLLQYNIPAKECGVSLHEKWSGPREKMIACLRIYRIPPSYEKNQLLMTVMRNISWLGATYIAQATRARSMTLPRRNSCAERRDVAPQGNPSMIPTMIVATENYSTRPTIVDTHQSIRDVGKVEHKQTDQNSGGGPGGKLQIEADKYQEEPEIIFTPLILQFRGQKRLEIGMPGGYCTRRYSQSGGNIGKHQASKI